MNKQIPAKYQQIALKSLQKAETRRLLSLFNAQAIPFIAFKGVTLQERIYAPGEIRPMTDIDLLFKKDDLGRVEVILQQQGYSFFDHEHGYSRDYAKHCLGVVSYNKGPMLAEMHWKLFPMYWYDTIINANMDGIWHRAEPTVIGDQPALRLCAEDEVLYLCFHLAITHGLAHPSGYVDIVGVIRESGAEFDWQVFVNRARTWRIRTVCWAVLWIIHMFAPEDVPEWVLPALSVSKWRRWLIHRLTSRMREQNPWELTEDIPFFGFLLADRILDWFIIGYKKVAPGPSYLRLKFDISAKRAFWRQFIYPFEYVGYILGRVSTEQ